MTVLPQAWQVACASAAIHGSLIYRMSVCAANAFDNTLMDGGRLGSGMGPAPPSAYHGGFDPSGPTHGSHERPPSRLFLRSLGAPCPGTRTLRWVIASGWANPPSPVTWVQLAHAKTPDGCRAPPSSTSHCTTWLWHCASRMAHLCVGGPRLDDPFRAPAMSMRRESPRIAHRYTLPVVRIFRSSTSPWS